MWLVIMVAKCSNWGIRQEKPKRSKMRNTTKEMRLMPVRSKMVYENLKQIWLGYLNMFPKLIRQNSYNIGTMNSTPLDEHAV